MADEWVDHALSKSKEEEAHWIATTKAYAEVKKKYKDLLFRLFEAERGKKSTEATLGVVERQAEEQHGLLQTVEEELIEVKKKIELQQKELEGKTFEQSKAEQAVYEMG